MAFVLAACCLAVGTVPARGQDGKVKELAGPDDNPPVEIMLGRTPEMGFLFASGRGVVTALVVIAPSNDPDKVKAKVVSFTRLWKDNKKPDFEYRATPQIKQVPFDDENGVSWTLLDGSKWKLGDEFDISKKNLKERVKAVPESKADSRNWIQKFGARDTVEGLDKALKILELSSSRGK